MNGFHIVGPDVDVLLQLPISHFIETVLGSWLCAEKGIRTFEFTVDNESWENVLFKLFSERGIKKGTQYVYKLDPQNFQNKLGRNLPEGFVLRKVDNDLLNNGSIKNLYFVKDIIHSFWDTEYNFMQKGHGYCVSTDDHILSFCYTGFVYSNIHTIGIETLQPFRRQGFGEVAARELLKQYLYFGIDPYWDCAKSNSASNNLAKRLGFHLDSEYLVYWFSLTDKKL